MDKHTSKMKHVVCARARVRVRGEEGDVSGGKNGTILSRQASGAKSIRATEAPPRNNNKRKNEEEYQESSSSNTAAKNVKLCLRVHAC
jgi:hypothetical protein